MRIFKKYQWIYISILFIVFVFLSISFLKNYYLEQGSNNQLAQVLSAEVNILRQWQNRGGLKKTLQKSSEGRSVVLLQRMLSQNIIVYPEKEITGYYGNLTKKAVVRFQKEYGLKQTGIVNPTTLKKLNEVFLAQLCPVQNMIYPDFLLRKVGKGKIPLPKDYSPPSLINISSKVKTQGTICLRENVAQSLYKMFSNAKKDGVYLYVNSGFRKFDIQKYLYGFWQEINGKQAFDLVAAPGTSEHQLGSTVDLSDASINDKGVSYKFAFSKGGIWMKKNAYKYGFVLSYPKGEKNITGYDYEPWHWRFVGVAIATKLKNDGLSYTAFPINTDIIPYPKSKPVRIGLSINAKSAVSIFVNTNGKEDLLISKNANRIMPIASITNLMTALVSSEMYSKNSNVVVNQKDLNTKAKEIGLKNTHFMNVTGLDLNKGSEIRNFSTANDIAKLLKYIYKNKPNLFYIITKRLKGISNTKDKLNANIKSTNRLLNNPDVALKVLGGEVGGNSKTDMNLAIVSKAPAKGYIINVVLGSNYDFKDMKKILAYIKNSFLWQKN